MKALKQLTQGDGLRQRSLRGTALTFLNFGSAQAMRLLSNLILTRLLLPEAFGLMAIVQVVVVGLQMFSDTGVHTSIVRSDRGDDPRFLNTAWVVQILRSALVWLLVLASAPFLARFYEQSILTQLLPVAALTVLINGFRSTKMATANRHLTLGRVTMITLISQVIGILAMIVLAYVWRSVWALAVGVLVGDVVRVWLSHTKLPGENNRFQWDRSAFAELFDFGKFIFVSSIATFLVNSGDRAVLGKFVSLTELGVYNIGFFLATVPLVLTRQFVGKIILPLYVKLPPADSAENRRKVFMARGSVTGAMLVGSIVLGCLGQWIIRLLYTDEYLLAGPIMVLIAVAYMPLIITDAYNSLLLGAGKGRDYTILLISMALVQFALLLFGVQHFGLIAAILAPPIAVLLLYPLNAFLARRQGGWDPLHDGLFAGLALVGGALALWINDTALTQVLQGG